MEYSSPAFDVATLLEIEEVGVLGETIFVGTIPEDIDNVVGVYDAGGISTLTEWQRDEMLIRFQIRSGVNQYNEGYNLANAVKEAFIRCASINLNAKDYIHFRLIGDINHLGVDGNNRHRFSLNARTTRENFGNSNRDLF